MSLDLFRTVMSANQSSLKTLMTITDTTTITNVSTASTTVTYPHNYGSDDIIVAGYVTTTYSTDPTNPFSFAMPYIDATGGNLASVSWDATNVYVYNSNGGAVGGSGTITRVTKLVVLIP